MRAKVFRPGRSGSAAVLGPLESRVMETVWRLGGEVTAGEVLDALPTHGRNPAYSTVKTILTNLTRKGYLRKRSAGRANAFRAVQSRSAFVIDVVGGVVRSLYKEYRNPLLAHLVGEMADDPQALSEFEHLLAQRKRKHSSRE